MFLIVPGKRKQKMILRLAQLNLISILLFMKPCYYKCKVFQLAQARRFGHSSGTFLLPIVPFFEIPLFPTQYIIYSLAKSSSKWKKKRKKKVFQLNTKFLSKTMSLSCPTKMPNLASLCLKTLAGTLVNINCCKWLCCTDVQLLKMIYCIYSNKHPEGAAI